MTAGVEYGIKELRDQIEVLTQANIQIYKKASLDYKCHVDTTNLYARRLERTGSVPAGRFRINGITAEEKVRQMYADSERRRLHLEELCAYQRDINLILKVANYGGDIQECWAQLHSAWERYTSQ